MVVYEVRAWFSGEECLYTDDPRAADLARAIPEVRVTGQYFRRVESARPFAWDITGPADALAPIMRTCREPALDAAARRSRS